MLKPFRSHGWSARIVRETDGHDCIEVAAERGALATRIAVLYSSSGISKSDYGVLSNRVQRIFFNGLLYMPESFASGATVPVEPLGDFFSYLVDLNKQVESDRSPPVMPRRPASVRRPDGGEPHRGDPRTPATVHERNPGRQACGAACGDGGDSTAVRHDQSKGYRHRLVDAQRPRLPRRDTARSARQEGSRALLRHDRSCAGRDAGLTLGTD